MGASASCGRWYAEFERLERAADAIARTGARSVPGLRSRVGRSSSVRAAAAGAQSKRSARSAKASAAEGGTSPARKGTGQRRTAAPRGQTQAKVLVALAAAPGSGPAAVATASGVSTGVATATLSRLVKQGRVRRLGAGRYAIVDAAGVAGPVDETAAAKAPEAPPPSPTG